MKSLWPSISREITASEGQKEMSQVINHSTFVDLSALGPRLPLGHQPLRASTVPGLTLDNRR